MASSFTTRKRLNKQATGDNTSTWGTVLNGGALDVLDFALDGWTTVALSGNTTLTTADGTTTANEAGARVLKLTTASSTYTVTLPAREGWYIVWNASTAAQTVASAGGGTTVSVAVGEVVFVVCDATNVKRLTLLSMESNKLQNVTDPTSNQDAATKKYVDDTAFNMAAGSLPAQTGNAGKFLTTDGTTASWASTAVSGTGLAVATGSTIDVPAAAASDVKTGTNATKALTAASLMQSSAFQTLTDAATVAWDVASGYNATVTLGGNRTIGAPSNLSDGQSICLELVQDGTGSRTVTWNAVWDFGAVGTPVLQTTAAKRDLVFGIYLSATSKIHASFRKGA